MKYPRLSSEGSKTEMEFINIISITKTGLQVLQATTPEYSAEKVQIMKNREVLAIKHFVTVMTLKYSPPHKQLPYTSKKHCHPQL
jgi:hypothetical protein